MIRACGVRDGNRNLQRYPEEVFIRATPCLVERQAIVPFHRFSFIRIAMGNLAS